MIFLLLALPGLVTVKTGDAFRGVLAHLEFVDDRVLLVLVTLGAFAGGFDELRVWLIDFDARAGALN